MTTLKVIDGPGNWDMMLCCVSILDREHERVPHFVKFRFEDGVQRQGRITGISEIYERFASNLRIEGYLTNGASPYREHGTPFTGQFSPQTRKGWLNIE
jgi:hypothetical protein